jgi:hypothetical protein
VRVYLFDRSFDTFLVAVPIHHRASLTGITISHLPGGTDNREAAIASRRFLFEQDATCAEAGKRNTLTPKTMNTNSNLSLANRKQLADMLADDYHGLRSKAKAKHRKKTDQLFESLKLDYVEKPAVSKVIDQINILEATLKQRNKELASLGFELQRDGDLYFTDDTGDSLRKSIHERVAKEMGTFEDIDARFDEAQIAMMTVASLEDAEKLLKSVTTI